MRRTLTNIGLACMRRIARARVAVHHARGHKVVRTIQPETLWGEPHFSRVYWCIHCRASWRRF